MGPVQENLLEEQSTRLKTKHLFIIFFVIMSFLISCGIILICEILKQEIESQSLSRNPVKAIRAICNVSPSYRTCIKSLSFPHMDSPSSKIDEAQIIDYSVRVAFHEFYNVISLPLNVASKYSNPAIKASLRDCQNLFDDSLVQLKKSLIITSKFVRSGRKISVNEKGISDLRTFLNQANGDIDKCFDGLWPNGAPLLHARNEMTAGTYFAKAFIENSLAIVKNKDAIHELLNPSATSILAFLLLAQEYYVLGVLLLCLRYLVLIFLFCFLLRVFRSKPRRGTAI